MSNAVVQIETHLWVPWTRIAIQNEHRATEGRAIALAAPDLQTEFHRGLELEWYAGLSCIVAAAHGLEAFYEHTIARAPLPPSLLSRWQVTHPNKRGRIIETLKSSYTCGKYAQGWSIELAWLFDLRNRVVHYRSSAQGTAPHPNGRVNTSPMNVEFSLEACIRAVDAVLDVYEVCLAAPKQAHLGLVEWCKRNTAVAPDLRAYSNQHRSGTP